HDEDYKGVVANFGLREYAQFNVNTGGLRINNMSMSRDRIFIVKDDQAWIYTLSGKLIWHRRTSDYAYDEVEFESSSRSNFTFFKEINGVAYLGTSSYMYKISMETGKSIPF